MNVRYLLLLVSVVTILTVSFPPSPAVAASDCQLVLGFKTLHDLIPTIVGDCRGDEQYNPTDGDGLQETTNGLLVWRKIDNYTAFTDGYRTWINGPSGLQERLNTQRFDWEKGAKVSSTTVINYVAPPTAGTVVSGACFSSSAAATRSDADRCNAGNRIYDPCFASRDNNAAVICVPNPLDPASIVQLNLSQPFASPTFVPAQKHPWFLQLADGTVCNFFTGATAGIGGERINYGCSDGWVVVGFPTTDTIWTVHEVRLATRSIDVQASATVEVMTAWE